MSKSKNDKLAADRALGILKGGLSNPHRTGPKKGSHPTGMEPRVDLVKGEAVCVVPAGQDPCWEDFLTSMGFGNMLKVLEVLEVRAWEVYVRDVGMQTQHYVRAKVRRRPAVQDDVDVAALIKGIKTRKIRKPKPAVSDHALLAMLADWQAGKRSGGGIKALIDRVFLCLDRLVERTKREKPARLILAGMGDIIEGCGDHYAMQTFLVELDRREQCRAVRHLLLEIIVRLAPLVPEIVVLAVGGNHGENRKNGKAFTTFGDNDDVAVFEQVAETCRWNPALSHVSFVIPDQELTVTLDVFGVPVAFAHGHQCRGGPKDARAIKWWKDMGHNDHPVGDCSILITGHYHHLKVWQTGPKTWMQCPALDGGSTWWENIGGDKSMPGILTVNVGKCLGPTGWDGMRVV